VICYDKIILELKAVSALTDEHRSQIINYLKATGMKLGLLIDSGAKEGVVIERFAN
jgi:GxxExxY protein